MRLFFRSVSIYGSGGVVAGGLASVSALLLTHYLTPAECGLIGLSAAPAALFSAAVGFGGKITYARFFFDN